MRRCDVALQQLPQRRRETAARQDLSHMRARGTALTAAELRPVPLLFIHPLVRRVPGVFFSPPNGQARG